MYVETPLSVSDFYAAARRVLVMEENEPQLRPKPRVSGISRDAREIAYMMANVPRTNVARGDAFFQAEQGRLMEDVTCKILASFGMPVSDRQISLPDDYPLTGHPDGVVHVPGTERWGFEHKHFGRWAYEDIMKKGLVEAAPEIVAQVSLYGDALNWDKCLVVITSQDASSIRSDMTRNKKAKNPHARWADAEDVADPKVMLFALDMRQSIPALVPALKQRAMWFANWYANDGDPTHVMWEHEPGKYWAWDYSEFGDAARRDPQGTLQAPKLPWEA